MAGRGKDGVDVESSKHKLRGLPPITPPPPFHIEFGDLTYLLDAIHGDLLSKIN